MLLRFVTGSTTPLIPAIVVVLLLAVIFDVHFWRVDHPKKRDSSRIVMTGRI
jgi:hypothetical protein